MRSIKVVILVITILLSGCSTRKITQQQAIEIAEQYVLTRGYTTVKVNLDSVRSSYDIMEVLGMSKEQIAEMRYNSLLPKAYKAYKHWGKWHVVFISNMTAKYNLPERDYDVGRIVSMAKRGRRIYILHEEEEIIPKQK
jgi:hypothetical protein